MLRGALVGRDAAGVGTTGRDHGEPGSLQQSNIVGIVKWLVHQLQ
jgi:hypothetical protein